MAAPVPTGTPPPIPPPRAPRGKVRWLPLILGIVVAVFGLLPLGVGVALYVADTALSVADADAEGTLPEATMRFDADDAQYDVFTFGRGSSGTEAAGTTCAITLADGEQQEIRGDRQAVASEGTTNSIGSFDAVEGPTEVVCRSSATGGRDTKIYVAQDNPTLEVGMWVGIGLGVVCLLGGAGLIVFGALVRKKPSV